MAIESINNFQMNQEDTELIFPTRSIHTLLTARSDDWEKFVKHIISPDVEEYEQLAFVLLVARLAGCGSCNSDSFRAMRGCSHCAVQIVRRYRGEDQDLLILFNQAKIDVKKFVEKSSAQ